MAAQEKSRTDQKHENRGTDRGGKINQPRPEGSKEVGSHKPGGDGPGKKKFKHEHDDRETRK
jgi:hypothetical protein